MTGAIEMLPPTHASNVIHSHGFYCDEGMHRGLWCRDCKEDQKSLAGTTYFSVSREGMSEFEQRVRVRRQASGRGNIPTDRLTRAAIDLFRDRLLNRICSYCYQPLTIDRPTAMT